MRRAVLIGAIAALVALGAGFASIATAAGSPSVTTGSASSVGSSSAQVSGTVDTNGVATQYAFQYGTSSLLGHETTLTTAPSGTNTVSAALTGLTSGTTYYYRIIAISSGGTATGGELTFKTTGTAPPPAQNKPTATTGSAQASVNGATVSASINPNGLLTNYYFEFGPTSAYGYQTNSTTLGASSQSTPVIASLAPLKSNTTYHYRVVAVNHDGTTVGSDATFQTLPSGSSLRFFGHTGFVAPQGVGGVFVGCIGESSCSGKMTISRSGQTIGQRQSFFIGANGGGIIHYTLTSTGRSLLAHYHHLRVNVTITPAGGQPFSGLVTLVPFT